LGIYEQLSLDDVLLSTNVEGGPFLLDCEHDDHEGEIALCFKFTGVRVSNTDVPETFYVAVKDKDVINVITILSTYVDMSDRGDDLTRYINEHRYGQN
jgi:hypothetical protein